LVRLTFVDIGIKAAGEIGRNVRQWQTAKLRLEVNPFFL